MIAPDRAGQAAELLEPVHDDRPALPVCPECGGTEFNVINRVYYKINPAGAAQIWESDTEWEPQAECANGECLHVIDSAPVLAALNEKT